ncbi:MAG: DsbA family protein [Candidatus Woesearchaeota archaeon]
MAPRKKKSSWKPFVIGIVIFAVIGALVFMNTEQIVIDGSQYVYSDEEVLYEEPVLTITKFSDFQCPACLAQAQVLDQLKAEYPVNVEYKHFPLSQIHPYAQSAAEASECARDQGRFWAYHDILFDNQPRFADNFLLQYAEALDLDMQAFRACLDNREKQVLVTSEYQEGLEVGVSGTPTLYVDGEVVEDRSYRGLVALVEQQGE